jgi:glycosyltransferase involved in cell wall biosynthesis
VSVVGGIHPRKGIDLLLAGFAAARLTNDDRLLFVGTMAPEIRELIERRYGQLQQQGRIATVDRYVTDYELHCGFLAADVVAVTYPRQVGSSGALVRAAVAKRPVLASDFGWIAWATETFELGTIVDVSDVERYADAIEGALAHGGEYRPSLAAERFCEYHTIANQKAHWLATIGRERGISLGSFERPTTWNSVMEAVGPGHEMTAP